MKIIRNLVVLLRPSGYLRTGQIQHVFDVLLCPSLCAAPI